MLVQQLEAETNVTTQIHVCYGSMCGIISLSLYRRNCMIGNLVSCQAGSRGRGRYRYSVQCTVYTVYSIYSRVLFLQVVPGEDQSQSCRQIPGIAAVTAPTVAEGVHLSQGSP